MVVEAPGLAHWDRLVIDGEPAAVADLLREVLAGTGETFRPFGTEELITEVVARLPELEVSARFAWMETTTPVKSPPTKTSTKSPTEPGNEEKPGWLEAGAAPEIVELIEAAYPESYARPGDPDVRRWAGIRDEDGRLVTVAAEAWSTPEIGFMSGVATRPSARGRGWGAAICAFTANELLTDRERVALVVDHWNTAAVATYTRLGFTTRRVAAAKRTTTTPQP
ncbi:hypothetical protein GCM10009828_015370 [Actinoplanes couchii]|uniref:N-acetyltransferase domain-containing protein n=1 Tax=Actinoplanes couchii TaxID=403638 RepID=A0ABQ3X3Z9_9ACTN|nr:hypothetical protein Aco03nite_016520 [Actinoplanes couchii]